MYYDCPSLPIYPTTPGTVGPPGRVTSQLVLKYRWGIRSLLRIPGIVVDDWMTLLLLLSGFGCLDDLFSENLFYSPEPTGTLNSNFLCPRFFRKIDIRDQLRYDRIKMKDLEIRTIPFLESSRNNNPRAEYRNTATIK